MLMRPPCRVTAAGEELSMVFPWGAQVSAGVRTQLGVIWAPCCQPTADIPTSEQWPVGGLHNEEVSQCTWQFQCERCKASMQKEIWEEKY